jgi:hypothetical protein
MNNQRDIDLGTIISITTGRLYSGLDKIQTALEYITNNEIYTHQIPIATDEATPYILSKYPELKGVGENEVFNNKEEVFDFVKKQKEIFGEELSLSPMSKKETKKSVLK